MQNKGVGRNQCATGAYVLPQVFNRSFHCESSNQAKFRYSGLSANQASRPAVCIQTNGVRVEVLLQFRFPVLLRLFRNFVDWYVQDGTQPRTRPPTLLVTLYIGCEKQRLRIDDTDQASRPASPLPRNYMIIL